MSRRAEHREVRFEPSDADPRRMLLLSAGMLLGLLIIFAALWGFYGERIQAIAASNAEREDARFTYGAEWEDRVTRDRQALWAVERERLTTFGWSDRDRGVLQVPVNDVLRYISEEDVPIWEPVTTPRTSPYKLSTDDD